MFDPPHPHRSLLFFSRGYSFHRLAPPILAFAAMSPDLTAVNAAIANAKDLVSVELRMDLKNAYIEALRAMENSRRATGAAWIPGCLGGVIVSHIQAASCFGDSDVPPKAMCSNTLNDFGLQAGNARRASADENMAAARRGLCGNCHKLVESLSILTDIDLEVENGFVAGSDAQQKECFETWVARKESDFAGGAARWRALADLEVPKLIAAAIKSRGGGGANPPLDPQEKRRRATKSERAADRKWRSEESEASYTSESYSDEEMGERAAAPPKAAAAAKAKAGSSSDVPPPRTEGTAPWKKRKTPSPQRPAAAAPWVGRGYAKSETRPPTGLPKASPPPRPSKCNVDPAQLASKAGAGAAKKAKLTPAKPEDRDEENMEPPETSGAARLAELQILDRISSGAMIHLLRQRRCLVKRDCVVLASSWD